ncbi:hypothetical protein DY000_02044473 [Brassica cretica]|uniref:Mitochondrial import inner membrane translocase subunit Tim21 n=1 Tax=Brassica cretica TaxID=69181 RepID=A0ABQ7ESQ9_BRACR|nr:hypothetical protein DY000_02044473 [Brassica cretica]
MSSKSAIAKFIPVAGQTVMRVFADRGAVASGLSTKDVRNDKYEGKEASYYEIITETCRKRYYYVKEGARLVHIIATFPNNPNEKNSYDRISDVQMPSNVSSGEASCSSKKKA